MAAERAEALSRDLAAAAERDIQQQAQRFTYSQLAEATKQFKDKLGGGGFGSVFMGRLPSGTQIAVKRLEQDSALGEAHGLPGSSQLETEVRTLSTASHPNVVPLLGWSADGVAPCLVYAFCEGGALEDRLAHRIADHPSLTARERILILSDVARGLAYLHQMLDLIHRDVKSANVLLDRGNVARIGDFGIARHADSGSGGGGARTKVIMTQHSSGTFLYMSPEAKNGHISTKMDSFAFGLVMLETLTGLPVHKPKPGREDLLELFEEEMETYTGLQVLLDKAAGSWEAHTARNDASHIAQLHGMTQRCLELQRKKRCEVADLIEGLESVRAAAESGPRRNIPTQFICSITGDIMRDPVTTADGHTYERYAIAAWLANSSRSPMTNQRLERKDLVPAVALRQLIQEFLAENPGAEL